MRTLPILGLLVSACYIQPSPGYQSGYQSAPGYQQPQPQPQGTPSSAPPPGALQQPPPSSGQRTVWQGRYTCAQGVTSLRLTVDGNCNGVSCSFSALFEFGPLPENPGVAQGAYRMAGEGHANAQGELEMSLQPTQWVRQPANYVMVGLVATADAQQALLNGRMDSPSCSGIALQRVQ
jgi:hypothetical protein